jgi:WhiB family transcriptional regulator, redox-sensing transcriptional regulator
MTDTMRLPLLVDLAIAHDAADYATQEWRAHALCRDMDTGWFYPARGAPHGEQRRLCRGCPVREACLDFALTHHEKFGVWGGVGERPTRRARARGLTAAEVLAEIDRRRVTSGAVDGHR